MRFHSTMTSIHTTIQAMIHSLSRPSQIIDSIGLAQKSIDRHLSSLRRSDRWPLGLLDDTRNKIHKEAADKVRKSSEDLTTLGSELRYTQQVVAGELASWQELHEKMAKKAIRELVSGMVVREKARLEGMKRALRHLRNHDDDPNSSMPSIT
jgi:hypothetical protein